jgi:hypothetical protein
MLAQSSGLKAMVGLPLCKMVLAGPWWRLKYHPLAGK